MLPQKVLASFKFYFTKKIPHLEWDSCWAAPSGHRWGIGWVDWRFRSVKGWLWSSTPRMPRHNQTQTSSVNWFTITQKIISKEWTASRKWFHFSPWRMTQFSWNDCLWRFSSFPWRVDWRSETISTQISFTVPNTMAVKPTDDWRMLICIFTKYICISSRRLNYLMCTLIHICTRWMMRFDTHLHQIDDEVWYTPAPDRWWGLIHTCTR